MSKKTNNVSNDEQDIYVKNGFANRAEYIRILAEDYGVPINTVWALAELLGKNEDFDGLPSALDDL